MKLTPRQRELAENAAVAHEESIDALRRLQADATEAGMPELREAARVALTMLEIAATPLAQILVEERVASEASGKSKTKKTE